MIKKEAYSMKVARVISGLTQLTAAETLKVTSRTLRNYETGASQVPSEIIEKAEELYGVKIKQNEQK